MKKKKKKADLTQANRWGGRRGAVEMHAVEAQASLSLSDVKRWNDLEVKKKNKKKEVVCLVWRRKTRKRKKKKRNETWMKMK